MSSNWNASLPQDTSKIKLSAGLIRDNWGAIDTSVTGTGYGFTRNHVTMTDGTNGGLHYRVDYYQPLSSPTLSGASSAYPRSVVYTSPSITYTELFYKTVSTSGPPTTQDMQLTNSTLTASSGQSMFPGGMQIRCGQATITGGTNTTITYSIPFPTAGIIVLTTCIGVPSVPSAQVNIISFSPSQFVAAPTIPGQNPVFYWYAVGY